MLLIVVVLRGVDIDRAAEVASGANPWLILVAFATYFVGYVASVGRWRTLLAAQGVRPRFGYLYCSFMIGMFFNQLLPTTIGGDLARYRYTAAAGRGAALNAVVLDRVFGTLSLAVFAALGFAFAGVGAALPPGLPQGIGIVLALGIAAIAVAFVRPDVVVRPLKRAIARWPSRFRERVGGLLDALTAFGGRYDVVLVAFAWSLLLQCVVITYYYVIGAALGLDLPMIAYAFIVPLAIVTMALPISINGIGVREGILGYLLGLHGVDISTSLVFAWIAYALLLVHGLLGGVVFAVVRAARHDEIEPRSGGSP